MASLLLLYLPEKQLRRAQNLVNVNGNVAKLFNPFKTLTMNTWKQKSFKTAEARDQWMENNSHKYQIERIFTNEGPGVEYRKLRKIGY